MLSGKVSHPVRGQRHTPRSSPGPVYYITRGVKLVSGQNASVRNTELDETNPLIDVF